MATCVRIAFPPGFSFQTIVAPRRDQTMDIFDISLHFLGMSSEPTPSIPNYELYREDIAGAGHFQVHLEPLHTRSERHRWEIDLHRHLTSFQIFAIDSGDGDAWFEGAYNRFKAPVIIFVPPGAIHGLRFSATSSGQVLTALAEHLDTAAANEKSLADFFSVPKILPQALHRESREKLSGLFDGIGSELTSAAPASSASASAHLIIALIEIFRQQPAQKPGTNDMSADRDTARITALQALISRHFREHRPASFYARQFGLTPNHLNRIARERTGMSVRRMAEERLITEAKRRLAGTNSTVIEIAEVLGFSDPAYFNRHFRRHTGMPPGQFRQKRRSG